MCLAVPARVIALGDHDRGTIEMDGVELEISLALVDDVAVGDYVIVHVGYALNKLDTAEAERTLALLAEAGVTSGHRDGADGADGVSAAS